ncbi:MAG TPA: class I SAM-dependent methyltransferase [Acidobacteriota bacterium]|nr:class I SAM-dependent methyltransferase [Acidobacteriota bacterium]
MSPAGTPSPPDRRPAGSCRVCGHTAGNRRHVAREMMFGFRDAFAYLECAACGCLQIEEIPSDIGKYYPERYYSFQSSDEAPLKQLLKRLRARHAIGRWNPVGWLLSMMFGPPPYARWVRVSGTGIHDPVLDVGCGSGALLRAMRQAGFDDLTGVDPYLSADHAPPGGVRILRQTLSETEGRYRLVLFNHSFEHLEDPEGALRESHRLLLPDGVLLLRVPVAGCAAWRRYGASFSRNRVWFLKNEEFW